MSERAVFNKTKCPIVSEMELELEVGYTTAGFCKAHITYSNSLRSGCQVA